MQNLDYITSVTFRKRRYRLLSIVEFYATIGSRAESVLTRNRQAKFISRTFNDTHSTILAYAKAPIPNKLRWSLSSCRNVVGKE
jgi:hypothetical protein